MKFTEGNGSPMSGHFVKLKDKEKISGVFQGDPFIFRQHWIGNRPVLCTGTGCSHCEEAKPGFRFHINLISKGAEGAYEAKIFAGGWRLYNQLKELHSEYDLEKTVVSITRNGSEKDTTYSILPMKNGTLTEEQSEKIKLVELLPLDQREFEAFEGTTSHEEEVPF